MKYIDPAIKEDLLDNLGRIELFQDLRGLYPYATDRLGALLFEEMGLSNPNIEYVTAYSMIGFESTPELDLWKLARRHENPIPAQNDKSYLKFQRWGFRNIGQDANPKGPSVVHNVNGTEYKMTPIWRVMLAVAKEAVRKSRAHYRDIQVQHGDLSADSVPRGKWLM
jgi:hypothetical protein